MIEIERYLKASFVMLLIVLGGLLNSESLWQAARINALAIVASGMLLDLGQARAAALPTQGGFLESFYDDTSSSALRLQGALLARAEPQRVVDILEKQATDTLSRHWLAYSLSSLGRDRDAALIWADIGNRNELFRIGRETWIAGDYETSSAAYCALTRLDPTVASYHHACGRVLLVMGNLERSRMHLLRASELNPGYSNTYVELGKLALRRERFEEARDWLQRAEILAPHAVGLGHVYADLGAMYEERGARDEAFDAYCKALWVLPREASLWIRISMHLESNWSGKICQP